MKRRKKEELTGLTRQEKGAANWDMMLWIAAPKSSTTKNENFENNF